MLNENNITKIGYIAAVRVELIKVVLTEKIGSLEKILEQLPTEDDFSKDEKAANEKVSDVVLKAKGCVQEMGKEIDGLLEHLDAQKQPASDSGDENRLPPMGYN